MNGIVPRPADLSSNRLTMHGHELAMGVWASDISGYIVVLNMF
jgi:hypothetical protein